jgi:type IV secretory pathway VirB4 component
METPMTNSLTLVFAAGVLAVLYGAAQTAVLMKASTGNDKMREIAAVYRRFGLNDRQIDILAQATPKRDYYCQSRAGDRLVMRSKGISKGSNGNFGNQYVHLDIAVPKELTPRQKELMEEFAKIEDEQTKAAAATAKANGGN